MKKIKRIYDLNKLVRKDKVLVIYGPRQVGKTTLVEDFLEQNKDKKIKYVTGDDLEALDYLSARSLRKLEEFVGEKEILVVDEAQKIPFIGENLKLIVDRIKGVKMIATGSASFELAGQVGEPLTGRKRTVVLYPISQLELYKQGVEISELRGKLDERLVYGSYPEVVVSKTLKEKRLILKELLTSYLLKDVLELERVKGAKVLWDLLRLLAFQIGSEVSLTELGNQLDLNKKTVARYLDLLEKVFVIYNLRGYSRNLRKEVTKKSKYYFYDVGIRNAIIDDFRRLELRDDIGELWENWLIMERLKRNEYKGRGGRLYFWRTWDQQEVDLVEERGGRLYGYEFKWRKTKMKPPKNWLVAYPKAKWQVVNRENWLEFVS